MERFITILLIGFFVILGTITAQAQQRYGVRSGVYFKIPFGGLSGPTQPKMSFGFQTNIYGYRNGYPIEDIRMKVLNLRFGHSGFDSFSLAGQKILMPKLGYADQKDTSDNSNYVVGGLGLLAIVALVAVLPSGDNNLLPDCFFACPEE